MSEYTYFFSEALAVQSLALCILQLWNSPDLGSLQSRISDKVCVVVVQYLSCAWLFVTPWPAACQASLSITISWSSLRLMCFESVMSSNHLILLPSIFPSISLFQWVVYLHQVYRQLTWNVIVGAGVRDGALNSEGGKSVIRLTYLLLLTSDGAVPQDLLSKICPQLV